MSNIVDTRIKAFGMLPKVDIVPPDDPILEIPPSEFQSLLKEMVLTRNQMAEIVRDAGIIRGRERARLAEDHAIAIKAGNHTALKEALV